MPTRTPQETTALAVALESESLDALYSAWLEVRLQHASVLAGFARERHQLDVKAEYLLKAVAAARELPDPPSDEKPAAKKKRGKKALVAADPLARFHAEAEAEVATARKALVSREAAAIKEFAKLDARVKKALLARADAHLRIHKPRLDVKVHPVGAAQVIIEVAAFGDEDAVLLTRLLQGKLPTRWGFFSDDAAEDLRRGAPRFYPDEGVREVWVEGADAEDALGFAAGDFLPIRQHLPFALPGRAFPRYRLVHHGPIAQIEARREGEPYAHLFRREDAERLTGYLLRLKLAGTLELELDVG